ncbi:M50 family metallopeptidase [Nocardioides bigeumensis]|uniref:Site-2 protease family protein n=1 Tax=Nocardioides bigeumensis TaxID=433657 RepID=A0ABP5JDM5_9ACTN
MTALLYVLGVVVFVAAILVSIGLHELGHMIPAKAFGGKVTQYFIGFGPTVWSRQVGETEYGVKAIPLGGYVKIVGMLPPGADDLGEVEHDENGERVLRVRKSNTGMFTQLISDARAAEWEHVKPGDEGRLFYRMAWWKKVVVMAGGPTVNILIAFFLFWGVYATYGNPVEPNVEPVVEEVLDCVVPYSEDGRTCEPTDEVTPAKLAGLQPGDEFVAVNGRPVTSWEELQDQIRSNSDGEVTLLIDRGGEQLEVTTNTIVTARPISEDPTDETLTQVGFLGVQPTVDGLVHGGPLYTVRDMGDKTVHSLQALAQLPVKVWGVAKAIVGVEERAADSPVSIVGGGRIAGETASTDLIPNDSKIAFLALIVGGFNLFIGLFNFVPLLPLDGGHIAGALYEALRRGLARLRRRPDPGYVDVARLLPVAYVVASALLVMGVVLIVGDLVAPVDTGF